MVSRRKAKKSLKRAQRREKKLQKRITKKTAEAAAGSKKSQRDLEIAKERQEGFAKRTAERKETLKTARPTKPTVKVVVTPEEQAAVLAKEKRGATRANSQTNNRYRRP